MEYFFCYLGSEQIKTVYGTKLELNQLVWSYKKLGKYERK